MMEFRPEASFPISVGLRAFSYLRTLLQKLHVGSSRYFSTTRQNTSLLHLPHPVPVVHAETINSQLYIGPTYPPSHPASPFQTANDKYNLCFSLAPQCRATLQGTWVHSTRSRQASGCEEERHASEGGGESEMWRGRTEGDWDRNRMVEELRGKGTRSDVGGSLIFFFLFSFV
jgi:hypothetical protein